MKKEQGRFIVLEGTDGSGKTTQFKALVARLKKEGIAVKTVDFPQYGKESSYFVRQYLNGKYGGLKEVGPYRASLFYALDRFDVGENIRAWVAEGKIVLANRYVSSNMGHQGAKFKTPSERRAYFKWLYRLEYKTLGIPRPDLTIVLHVPAATAQKLVDKKGAREYIGGIKRDIHEADLAHLKRAEQTYLDMVKMFPKEFVLVECVKQGRLRSVSEIREDVWRVVKKKLWK
ncbi:MAG: hypothetical protein A2946_00300 [Candidatus Liptonbacteria bacterium RIFCSPLOWO2_01_FULL_53_13]|uniref:Thymidylate kinase n=1 Tax=Candidatus Liptonbacteria bacterium RIFCSPLOWO2_01_FULL_53_13 TaxID=1798651 RepID=A0A1G2CIV5_9BACT|nr:MAG: hypothetical protein A2946_00300 [Candidatus Liptonbacteria bacterium RIFCSPLOWO2_01_FULL_53_13]